MYMEDSRIIAALILVAIFAWPVYIMCKALYSLFDHSRWDKDSKPSFDAKIVDINFEKVQYTKNGMKYKTTVSFSDGFKFITHKTNRKDSFFTYQISIDETLRRDIIEKANRLHIRAVENAYKKTQF